MILAFVEEQRSKGYAVESICRVLTELGLQIAARTYRLWNQANRNVAARTISDAQVEHAIRTRGWKTDAEGVRRLAAESLYGRRKWTALLRRTDPETSRGAVDRAMRTLGLVGARRCKRVRTTISDPEDHRAQDLLDRNFTAPAPDKVWVTDFTYVRTWSGFAYVAFIVDVYAQRIVAWHAAMSKSTDLALIPLRMALWTREHEGHRVHRNALVHHSDAGSQYTSMRFTQRLAFEGIRPSIGTVADAYDNALMESINGIYKTECIRTTIFRAGPLKTLSDVEYATASWVEWYNQRRLHGSLNMQTPIEFEQAHYAALNRELHPV